VEFAWAVNWPSGRKQETGGGGGASSSSRSHKSVETGSGPSLSGMSIEQTLFGPIGANFVLPSSMG